uniref:Uncharacterized protein n=1 Tax=Rhizobium phage P9VFCI TaxID=2763531 RepID=A0A7G7WXI6_9CAUD
MEKQLRFDLGDRYMYLDALMEGKRIDESQDWQIYYWINPQRLWLGIRTNGPVETEHDFVEYLSPSDAAWLRDHRHVRLQHGVEEVLESLKNELTLKSFMSRAA